MRLEMNEVNVIKRFILRALMAAYPTPLPGEALDAAVRTGVNPRPLMSDVELAKRDLEARGMIVGTRDPVDDSVSWALTPAGVIQAKPL